MQLNDKNLNVLKTAKFAIQLQEGIDRAKKAALKAAARKQALRMGRELPR